MIEYIKGPIASLTPTDVVIETTSGVAYITVSYTHR
ncbi:MAG: Holliday junction branch migration protein RuvA, partial [Muribaculaceae bacterium]|nr:Holliday junction branch migration protein RuvA [Muribaculaceae bacterium]